MTRLLQNFALAAAALLLALLVGEFASRWVVEPVDVLRPQLVAHATLGHALEPGSGGHDGWGFRNRAVPVSADIVAIGDSQTYGVSAPARLAWPSILGEMTGRSVYNLALGGYGPGQYFHLLADHALRLRPRLVLIGFYLGNDLLEAQEFLRRGAPLDEAARDGANGFGAPASRPSRGAPLLADLRARLAQHSLLYNLAVHSAVGEWARGAEARWTAGSKDDADSLRYERSGMATGFTPKRRLAALDLRDQRVAQGLRISLDLFARMQKLCAERNTGLSIVMIPTKESVYAKHLLSDSKSASVAALRALLNSEQQVRVLAASFFSVARVAYVDTLPALQAQVGVGRPLYPGNFDGHPNGDGYRVIAETIAKQINVRGGHE